MVPVLPGNCRSLHLHLDHLWSRKCFHSNLPFYHYWIWKRHFALDFELVCWNVRMIQRATNEIQWIKITQPFITTGLINDFRLTWHPHVIYNSFGLVKFDEWRLRVRSSKMNVSLFSTNMKSASLHRISAVRRNLRIVILRGEQETKVQGNQDETSCYD